MYFNIPTYQRDFVPPCQPEGEWEQSGPDRWCCTLGKATLSVFRGGEGQPWWAECENPAFESKAWFFTAEQAQYWAEKEVKDWFR